MSEAGKVGVQNGAQCWEGFSVYAGTRQAASSWSTVDAERGSPVCEAKRNWKEPAKYPRASPGMFVLHLRWNIFFWFEAQLLSVDFNPGTVLSGSGFD